jgi:hypothetical protein
LAIVARVSEPSREKLRRIYLDDHHALLVAGRRLAVRMLGSARDPALEAFLRDLVRELDDDRASLRARLAAAGASPSRLKAGLGTLAERAGRLKPNGSLLRASPLTRLVELDGIRLVLESNRSLWRALEHTSARESDARERAERAEQGLADTEGFRLAAAEAALADDEAEPERERDSSR